MNSTDYRNLAQCALRRMNSYMFDSSDRADNEAATYWALANRCANVRFHEILAGIQA